MAQPSRRCIVRQNVSSLSPLGSARTVALTSRRGDHVRSFNGSQKLSDRHVDALEPRQLMAVQPTVQLINAVTDKVIATMTDGMRIDMGAVGTKLNIKATPAGTAGSIVFKIDGKITTTETYAPYAIGGDDNGNYRNWTPPTGTHTLAVLQYSKAGGTGIVTTTKTLKFTAVAPSSTPTPVPSPPPPPTSSGLTVQLMNADTDQFIANLATTPRST